MKINNPDNDDFSSLSFDILEVRRNRHFEEGLNHLEKDINGFKQKHEELEKQVLKYNEKLNFKD